ncbi:hypothetical protein SAMN05444581_1254 [Methylocapsa palsarum]|uniref:Uncharacterized protein n=1 Tax=Methylocapsa palsarum TaxID=1612308 RepID=A0A1I4CNC7_9HYPH|nr:hypothetical protein SAMN05444581_1254 [Methylocapsa palsarum]
MPRAITPIKAVKPALKGRKQTGSAPARAPVPKGKSSRPGPGAKPASPSKAAASTSAPLGQVSKGDLRVQIEKLEQVNAKLRSKNREAAREAKLSANRIAELEQQVAELGRRLKPKAAPVGLPAKPSKTKNSKQRDLAAAGRGAPSGSSSAATTLPEQAAETAGGDEAGAS